MKIRTKLFFSFIIIAGLSAFLASFSAIYSISEKYESIAVTETLSTCQNAENFFYEYLGDLTRKAAFLSTLKEIVDNMEKPEELSRALENKDFFLYNIDIKVISPEIKIIASYSSSPGGSLKQEELAGLPFFEKERDPLLRDAGIFKIKNKVCILVVAPIIEEASFSFKGYLMFELYLSVEFADQLKEKIKGELLILSGQNKLASTFQDDEGQRYFPEIPSLTQRETGKLEIAGDDFLVTYFPITGYNKNTVGKIVVAVNIRDILVAKGHGIRSILKVLAIAVLFVIIISLFVGKKLTDSILRLSRGAEALAKGQFDIRIEPTSGDEIGHLTEIFNEMTQSLKTHSEEILDLKLFFEKIIENSPSAIIICDIVSNALTINPAAEKLFNITIDDVKGKEIFDVINLPLALQADFYQVILSGQPTSYDSYRLSLSDGEDKIFRMTFYEVALKKTNSIAIQIEDITESLRLEEELTHAQKLGTLGDVLSRFTHEFNNLMTGIIGHISLLKAKMPPGDKNYNRILSIEDLSTKAQELGKNVLSFSKKEKMEVKRIEIKKLIDSVINLVEKTVFKDVGIKTNYKAAPFYTMANREKLSLALLNLLINAKDAVKGTQQDEGVISITVDRIQNSDGKKYLRIRIADNGSGIMEKNLVRIFDPYFTTKGKKGTGLGLATVKDIVEKCGGTIEVESLIGKGTTFDLQFPESE
ncbi:MAG: PAS domain S-box protein [bacterium]|nr:PAS domain S-box protein [bacterium]